MRIFAVMMTALALCACAAGGGREDALGPNPFPVERGSAPPPPASAGVVGAAPPEGRAREGAVDFGQWRGADPSRYGPAFEAQMTARLTGGRAAAKADLETNGFSCVEQPGKLDCRIEIMERQCAYDWYVVLEDGRAAPAAGFDQMCLGAR